MKIKHIVSVSSGAPSALLAIKVIEKYGKDNVLCVFADTLVEHPDNYRFLYDLRKSGIDILFTMFGKTPEQLQLEQRTIFTNFLAPCTRILKLEPIRKLVQTLQSLGYECHMHIGYTVEDKRRIAKTKNAWIRNGVIPHFILFDESYVRHTVYAELTELGFDLPETYKKRFPNANCIAGGGCVRGGKAYMQRMLIHYPEYYDKAEKMELTVRYAQYKAQRAKGVRVADIKLYARLKDTKSPSGHITLKAFRELYEQSLVSQPMFNLFTLDNDMDGLCGVECGVSEPEKWD